MKREYVSRGRRVEVEELEGVVALHLPRLDLGERMEAALPAGATVNEGAGAESLGIRDDDWKAFQAAGWAFVRQEASLAEMLGATPEVTPGAEARAFRDTDGRLLLGSDRLTVRLREEMSEDEAVEALRRAGLTPIRKLGFAPNLFQARVESGMDFLDTSVALWESGAVEYAEPEFIEHMGTRSRSDPDYDRQWHLKNNVMPGADLGVEAAWVDSTGAGTCIAVVDTGLRVGHPDLAAALTPLSGSFYPDPSAPARFVQGLDTIPVRDHGTQCSGVAAARADNGEGGCGVAFDAQLTFVGCLKDELDSQSTLARAVAYAADPRCEIPSADPSDGADVISCSLGPDGRPWTLTQVLQDAIDFATREGRVGKGTPVFWATDNAKVSTTQDQVCSYERVTAVGGSTAQGDKYEGAYGPALAFLAPAVDIYSTSSEDPYRTNTGTSLAAAAAAGVAALILAANPDLRWEQVRKIMEETCDKASGGSSGTGERDDHYGYGRVNAGRAVEAARADTGEASFAFVAGNPTEAIAGLG